MSENKDYHNSAGLLALLSSITFVVVFFIYMVTLNRGVDLDEKVRDYDPNAASAPAFNLAKVQEPWVATPEIIAEGEKLYKQTCAACHGAKGDLVGGIPNSRNLVEGKWTQGGGLINNFKVIQHGIAGTQMIGYQAVLPKNDRWAIVHFIENITNNKSKASPEEVAAFAATAE